MHRYMLVMSTSYTQCLTEPMCSAVHGFRQSVYDVGEDARLDIEFALNVVGTTQFPIGLIVSGTITAEAVDTTSKRRSLWCPHLMLSLYIGSSDFDRFSQRNVFINGDYPSTDILLFTVNDEATLEYEDRVLLRFTPTQATLIPGLASNYEYIRDTAIVNIIDDDRKCLFPIFLFANGEGVPFSIADQFQRV